MNATRIDLDTIPSTRRVDARPARIRTSLAAVLVASALALGVVLGGLTVARAATVAATDARREALARPTLELPREWRWERPAVDFDDMFPTLRDAAARL